jgi:hypothetical protein
LAMAAISRINISQSCSEFALKMRSASNRVEFASAVLPPPVLPGTGACVSTNEANFEAIGIF